MKFKVIFFVIYELCFFISSNSFSQSSNSKLLFQGEIQLLNTIEISLLMPDTSCNGNRIELRIHTINQSEFVDTDMSITNNVINLESCYFEGPFTTPDLLIYTFSINEIEDTFITLDARIYYSFLPNICSKWDSLIVSLKFNWDGLVSAIPEQMENLGESIYPNPFNRCLFIKDINLPARIKIYNLVGNKIIDEKIYDYCINCSFLAKGIYYIELNKRLFKIIKQ